MTFQVRLLPNDIAIWFARLDKITDIKALQVLLSSDELKRASRFKFGKHRRRFIITKGLLRQLLSRYTGIPAQKIQFAYTGKGKPEIVNHALQFNVSHSHELVAYVFSAQRAVGIDVEYMEKKIEILDLAQRFFAEPEYEQLKAMPEEKRNLAFFNVWTRKEAFVKAIGEGLYYPLKDFVVSALPEKTKLISVKGQPSLAEQWKLQQLNLKEKYAGTFAISGRQIYRSVFYEYLGSGRQFECRVCGCPNIAASD